MGGKGVPAPTAQLQSPLLSLSQRQQLLIPSPSRLQHPTKHAGFAEGPPKPDLKSEQGCFCAEEHGEPEFLHPGPLQSLTTSLEETSCRELLTHTFLSLALNSWFHVSCGAPDKHPPAPNLPSQPSGSRAFPLSEVSSPRQAQAACHDGSEPKDSLIPWKTAGPQTTRDPTPSGETYRRRDVVPLVLLPAEDKELGFCKHPDHHCSTKDEQLPCALCS